MRRYLNEIIANVFPWNLRVVAGARLNRARQSDYIVPFDYGGRENALYAEEIKTGWEKMLALPNEAALRAYVAEFEKEFARAYHASAALGVGSGTAALVFALLSSQIGKGDEVIAPAHTYISSILAIMDVGAVPVLVDVKEDLTIDPEKIVERITPRTKAIVPVHIYGYPCDMPAIMKIANRHNLRVIEDACQGHATRINGRPAGTFGDFGCFSFHYSKQIGAPGDGGMVICRDPKYAQGITVLREPVYMDPLVVISRRTPSRLAPALVPFLSVKLKKIHRDMIRRTELVVRYDKELAGVKQVKQLPRPSAGREHGWRSYTVRVQERASLQAYLGKRRIETKVIYPVPLHLRPELRGLKYGPGDFPVYEAAQEEILSLPFSAAMPVRDAEKVGKHIRGFYSLDE